MSPEIDPTPTEIDPMPSEIDPTPTEIDPTSTEIDPMPTEIDPTPTEIDPTPTEIDPTPTEPAHDPQAVAHPSACILPPSTRASRTRASTIPVAPTSLPAEAGTPLAGRGHRERLAIASGASSMNGEPDALGPFVTVATRSGLLV